MKRALRLGILALSAVLVVLVIMAQQNALGVQTHRINAAIKPTGAYVMLWSSPADTEWNYEIFYDVQLLRNGYFTRPFLRSTEDGLELNAPWWFVGMCWAVMAVPGWIWARGRRERSGFPVEQVAHVPELAHVEELVGA